MKTHDVPRYSLHGGMPLYVVSLLALVGLAAVTAAVILSQDTTISQQRAALKERASRYTEEVRIQCAAVLADAGAAIGTLNPNKHLADARNTQRKADVNTILSAVYQYMLDNKGMLPTAITTNQNEICATGTLSCVGLADLSVLTVHSRYLVSMPIDTLGAIATGGDGYLISRDGDGRVVVTAAQAENDATISVTR